MATVQCASFRGAAPVSAVPSAALARRFGRAQQPQRIGGPVLGGVGEAALGPCGCARPMAVLGGLAWPRHGGGGGRGLPGVRCAAEGAGGDPAPPMVVGTPVVVTSMPPFLKSADSMPALKRASLVRVGEPGRVVDRRPKNTWAVRFKNGVFLIDGKYIEPL